MSNPSAPVDSLALIAARRKFDQNDDGKSIAVESNVDADAFMDVSERLSGHIGAARMSLDENGVLNIVSVPDRPHNNAVANVSEQLNNIVRQNGWGSFIRVSGGLDIKVGPATVQRPDVCVSHKIRGGSKVVPGRPHYPRVIFEIQTKHANVRQLHNLASDYLSTRNPTTNDFEVAVVVGLLFYDQRVDGTSAALCIVLERHMLPTTAISFGSAEVDAQTDNTFAQLYPNVMISRLPRTDGAAIYVFGSWIWHNWPQGSQLPANFQSAGTINLHEVFDEVVRDFD